jgi:hypothetical protein
MIFRQQELLEAFSEGDEIIANLGSGSSNVFTDWC